MDSTWRVSHRVPPLARPAVFQRRSPLPENPKEPQLTTPPNSLPNNNLPHDSAPPAPINARLFTIYDSSQIPTQQHLPNSCTIRTAQNRPKEPVSCPHIGHKHPQNPFPNLTRYPCRSPQLVTSHPHPRIIPAASNPRHWQPQKFLTRPTMHFYQSAQLLPQ